MGKRHEQTTDNIRHKKAIKLRKYVLLPSKQKKMVIKTILKYNFSQKVQRDTVGKTVGKQEQYAVDGKSDTTPMKENVAITELHLPQAFCSSNSTSRNLPQCYASNNSKINSHENVHCSILCTCKISEAFT